MPLPPAKVKALLNKKPSIPKLVKKKGEEPDKDEDDLDEEDDAEEEDAEGEGAEDEAKVGEGAADDPEGEEEEEEEEGGDDSTPTDAVEDHEAGYHEGEEEEEEGVPAAEEGATDLGDVEEFDEGLEEPEQPAADEDEAEDLGDLVDEDDDLEAVAEGPAGASDVLAEMGEFAQQLRDGAEKLEGIASAIKADDLGDNPEPSEATKAKVKGSISRMPKTLREGFKSFIADRSFPECQQIAGQLADEGKIDDAERFAGWLYWAGKSA